MIAPALLDFEGLKALDLVEVIDHLTRGLLGRGQHAVDALVREDHGA